jgi:hypothetical protein
MLMIEARTADWKIIEASKAEIVPRDHRGSITNGSTGSVGGFKRMMLLPKFGKSFRLGGSNCALKRGTTLPCPHARAA